MTGTINVSTPVKKAEMSIVVTRADGSIEDLGVVARYDAAQPAELTEDKQSITRRLLGLVKF